MHIDTWFVQQNIAFQVVVWFSCTSSSPYICVTKQVNSLTRELSSAQECIGYQNLLGSAEGQGLKHSCKARNTGACIQSIGWFLSLLLKHFEVSSWPVHCHTECSVSEMKVPMV